MQIETNTSTRPAERALQVYLDSSDYSVLSKAMHDSNHPDAGIFSQLVKYVDQGRIEIRFSAIHIIEIAHLDSPSRGFAVERARCIQRLTGGKCFRFFLEMRAVECANLAFNRPIYEGVFSNNSFWHPDLSDVALSLDNLLIDEFRKAVIDVAPNRKHRKMAERLYLRNGRLTEEGVRMLRAGRGELLDAMSKQFPLSDRFYEEDLMLQLAAGKVAAAEVADELSIVFRDVAKFIGWTYDTRDTERKLVTWLRSFGGKLVSDIETLRARVQDLKTSGEIASAIGKWARSAIDQKIPLVRTEELTDVWKMLMDGPPSAELSESHWLNIRDSAFGAIPSLDAYIMGFGEHFIRNVQMNRKLKASDAADLFHLACLPYCDIFRADGDTAETAKPLAMAYNARIVSKLVELPTQIARALDMRGLAG